MIARRLITGIKPTMLAAYNQIAAAIRAKAYGWTGGRRPHEIIKILLDKCQTRASAISAPVIPL